MLSAIDIISQMNAVCDKLFMKYSNKPIEYLHEPLLVWSGVARPGTQLFIIHTASLLTFHMHSLNKGSYLVQGHLQK